MLACGVRSHVQRVGRYNLTGVRKPFDLRERETAFSSLKAGGTACGNVSHMSKVTKVRSGSRTVPQAFKLAGMCQLMMGIGKVHIEHTAILLVRKSRNKVWRGTIGRV
jgi:hypothetical protein